jgi:hypothetical protein
VGRAADLARSDGIDARTPTPMTTILSHAPRASASPVSISACAPATDLEAQQAHIYSQQCTLSPRHVIRGAIEAYKARSFAC